MDDHQRHITEGAGLQESRLNTEFIDWLKNWGTKLLWLVLIAAGLWALYTWNGRRVEAARDAAFVSLDAALEAQNPENLVRVAEASKGKGAVASIATLKAADLHLQSGRRGVAVAGDSENEDHLLDEAEKTRELDKAEQLYRQVLNRVRGDKSRTLQEMQARAGLAACAITRRNIEDARTLIAELEAFARKNDFIKYADWNAERLANLDELLAMPQLYVEDDIAAAWVPMPSDNLQDSGGFGPVLTEDEEDAATSADEETSSDDGE